MKASILNFSASQRLRIALFVLPVLLVLVMESPQVSAGDAENAALAAGEAVTTENTATAMPHVLDTAGAAADAGGKDLKVFFIIGMAVNIMLIAAFLFWASGQWRKTRK